MMPDDGDDALIFHMDPGAPVRARIWPIGLDRPALDGVVTITAIADELIERLAWAKLRSGATWFAREPLPRIAAEFHINPRRILRVRHPLDVLGAEVHVELASPVDPLRIRCIFSSFTEVAGAPPVWAFEIRSNPTSDPTVFPVGGRLPVGGPYGGLTVIRPGDFEEPVGPTWRDRPPLL